MREYVADIIGEEYKDWKRNQIIFISAPTGSGKTTFVLERLVEHAALTGSRILYLVNRRMLKEQLEDEIDVKIKTTLRKNDKITEENLNKAIELKMYHAVEEVCRKDPSCIEDERSKYDYIVADECHYFLEDSIFNTYTELSYDWIMNKRGEACLIFISATISKIKNWIFKNNPEFNETSGVVRGVELDNGTGMNKIMSGKEQIKEYDAARDYSYVELQVLDRDEDINTLVKEKKGKWLIFVDNIDAGEEISNSLKKAEIDTIFIDARSKNKVNVSDTVNDIVRTEKFEQQVLVATCVLDNGISLRDIEIRNLIIMADTYEGFIQMLGRRRYSDELVKLHVYISPRNQGAFERRLARNTKRMKFISRYSKYKTDGKLDTVLENVMRYEEEYYCAKNTCYVWEGSLKLNRFSVGQCAYLQEYYQKLIDRFEREDSFAFLRQQAEWLEMSEKEINEICKVASTTVLDRVEKVIDAYIGKEMDKNENIEMREKIRLDLRKLLSNIEGTSGDNKTDIDDLGKKSSQENLRTLSDDRFNKIMDTLKLGYKMEKPSGNTFKITKFIKKTEESES